MRLVIIKQKRKGVVSSGNEEEKSCKEKNYQEKNCKEKSIKEEKKIV
ncbi:MAG: hypothetical protein WC788_04795 [Candidatus Paceibacterota bacterium]|jgi:hypothetical protein